MEGDTRSLGSRGSPHESPLPRLFALLVAGSRTRARARSRATTMLFRESFFQKVLLHACMVGRSVGRPNNTTRLSTYSTATFANEVRPTATLDTNVHEVSIFPLNSRYYSEFPYFSNKRTTSINSQRPFNFMSSTPLPVSLNCLLSRLLHSS